MDETQTLFEPSKEQSSGEIVIDQDAVEDGEKEQDSTEKKAKGKLPPIPKVMHENSKVAADEALKKFFNRR